MAATLSETCRSECRRIGGRQYRIICRSLFCFLGRSITPRKLSKCHAQSCFSQLTLKVEIFQCAVFGNAVLKSNESSSRRSTSGSRWYEQLPDALLIEGGIILAVCKFVCIDLHITPARCGVTINVLQLVGTHRRSPPSARCKLQLCAVFCGCGSAMHNTVAEISTEPSS